MRREARKYLFDVRQAADELLNFTAGKTRAHYLADGPLQAAVERKFEIIGEAVGQLAKLDAALAAQIPEYRRLTSLMRGVLLDEADTAVPGTSRRTWTIRATGERDRIERALEAHTVRRVSALR